jgi:prophage antirepressor-like protein
MPESDESNNSLMPLTFPGSGEKVRIIWRNGEPWWVAPDICRELGIAQAHKAMLRIEEDDRATIPVTDSLGREQDTYIVNEAGLYELIFMSRKPQAKAFKRWVFKEVIPTIREHGFYEEASHREQRVMRLASEMDSGFREIEAAWRKREIPHKIARAVARNHGILTEAVGFPEVMTTSGEIDDDNGIEADKGARLQNGRNRSKMYKGDKGREPFKAPTYRRGAFRIVNQYPRSEIGAIPGFTDRQIDSNHVRAIEGSQ